MASFIQLNPISDIVLRDYSPSSDPQDSLNKVRLLLSKYVLECEQNFFFYFDQD
jgi:hypothetical protein